MKANGDRLLAVGDIHGCRDLLQQLLLRVKPNDRDRLVFLGDYIDRGPDPRGVIDCLLELRRRWPRTVFLKGNHEAMLLDFLAGRNRLRYLLNGGQTTLDNYRHRDGLQIPPQHLEFFRSLRLHFETEQFIFTHAGLRPGLPLEQQSEEDLLWIRTDFLDSDYSWGRTVVFGHTPLTEPLLTADRIGLDTGAVFGRMLTCCDVLRRQVWSVPPP